MYETSKQHNEGLMAAPGCFLLTNFIVFIMQKLTEIVQVQSL